MESLSEKLRPTSVSFNTQIPRIWIYHKSLLNRDRNMFEYLLLELKKR